MFALLHHALVVGLAFVGAASLPAAVVVERSVAPVAIRDIARLPSADLVVLDGGFEAGLRLGMVCTVTRQGGRLGELLLVELRSCASSALILDLAKDASLQPGDQVAVKTVSTRS